MKVTSFDPRIDNFPSPFSQLLWRRPAKNNFVLIISGCSPSQEGCLLLCRRYIYIYIRGFLFWEILFTCTLFRIVINQNVSCFYPDTIFTCYWEAITLTCISPLLNTLEWFATLINCYLQVSTDGVVLSINLTVLKKLLWRLDFWMLLTPWLLLSCSDTRPNLVNDN